MNDKQLKEVALKYISKSYSQEDMRYGDDMYNATPEEKDKCGEYMTECMEIGTDQFSIKYDVYY